MSDYIVSARKYRPDSFETLIGQDNIAQTLKNSIIRGKLAHAYLFCGPRGVGKTTTARIFAKAINCANPSEDMEPCGKCESCVSFQEGRSYCIHELDAASNNGVEDIKNLMDQVQIPPQVGKYSVYIIDEVHMLSTAAFNAFLKTLEEPPAHAIFILATTEKHKILPTILSRCQTYDFNRISIPDMVLNLRNIASKENVKIDDETLHVIAQKADGAMRDALTIFDQTVAFCGSDIKYEDVIRNLNVLDYDYSFALVDDFLAGDYGKALLTFDEILSKGFNALHFCSALSSHLRDLMVTKNGGLDALLELPESLKKRYVEQASRCSLKFLYDALGVTTACESGYKMAVNPRLHIEFALMKLSFLVKAPGGEILRSAQNDSKPATQDSKPATQESKPAVQDSKPAAGGSATEGAERSEASEHPSPAGPRPARKKPAKTGSALSLNAILEEEEQEKKKEVKKAQDVSDELPEDEAILNAWKTIPEEFKALNQIRLANTLENSDVEIGTADGMKVVTFKVSNEAQRKWIQENRLLSLEGNLQKKTGSSKIRLEVGVIPMEEKEVQPYTDQEKATALMGQNGELRNLVKDFGLETR
ncbi:MAG: DNA polymerase III subunit gamma/tau [Bacteroidales bacterium]|nr:DNA polymerase III subunit gamma/tau [Bacteroidales bacterium]